MTSHDSALHDSPVLPRWLWGILILLLISPTATFAGELGVGATGLANEAPDWEVGQLRVITDGERIIVVMDRFEEGLPADGRVDEVIAFDSGEPIRPLSAEGFGMVKRQPERLLVTLPSAGLVLDLAMADAAPDESTRAHREALRYHQGHSISTWTPASDEFFSTSEAVGLMLQQETPISPAPLGTASAPLLQKDPNPGGGDTCAKSCSKESHSGAGCRVNCNLGQCAKCTLDPLVCKCVDA